MRVVCCKVVWRKLAACLCARSFATWVAIGRRYRIAIYWCTASHLWRFINVVRRFELESHYKYIFVHENRLHERTETDMNSKLSKHLDSYATPYNGTQSCSAAALIDSRF